MAPPDHLLTANLNTSIQQAISYEIHIFTVYLKFGILFHALILINPLEHSLSILFGTIL